MFHRYQLLFAALIALLLFAYPRTSRAQQGNDKQLPHAGAFTLEQVLDAPFPSELVAAPSHGRVAWVFNARGARNVWVAEPTADGSYKARALTSYSGDDGEAIGQLTWDAEAENVIYVRGGDMEGGGPPTNLLSLPTGAPPQKVLAVSVSQGAPREIGDGATPAASPKGGLVAYVSEGQVWLASLKGNARQESLIRERGNSGSLTWSPDGARLAFISNRGSHAIVGVYDFARKSVVWLAPSVDHDLSPEWSPDGKQVAFIRIPASDSDGFNSHTTGQPWSIWVADAATGKGREAWKADTGSGSLFHGLIYSERQLFWGAGDRIIFPWEKTEWVNLYTVQLDGRSARALVLGNFEVFDAALTPDRKQLIYSSNQDDIDRQHVWRVPVQGGAPEPLTPGQGVEGVTTVTSDGQVAMLRSGAKASLRPAIVTSKGQIKDLAEDSIPADFPEAKLVIPQQVIFPAADGLMIHGQLFLPPGDSNTVRRPALIFFHGGPTRQMLLGWHPMDFYDYAYGMNQYLASEGYLVLSVNYRGGCGYGLDFRVPLDFGFTGSSEYNDILGAGLYMRSRADVDAKRIGLWGGSYGGVMTSLGLARSSDMFAAGVDYAGAHDWKGLLPFLSQPDTPPEVQRKAWESSSLASIKEWRSPVLVIAADDDRNVPFTETVKLIKALRKQGVEFEQIVIPDEVHDLILYRNLLLFFHATDDFLARHLRETY